MSPRATWIALPILAILAFAVSTVWWVGFVYSESCHAAGGVVERGICVGARFPVSWLWEAPWYRIAFDLLPPVAVAGIVVLAAWFFIRTRGPREI
jgi:hypothetical protein